MDYEHGATNRGLTAHTANLKDIIPPKSLRKTLRNYRRAFKSGKPHLNRLTVRSSQRKPRRAAERYDIRKCSRKGKRSLNKDIVRQKRIEKIKLISESAYHESMADGMSESSMSVSCASHDFERVEELKDLLKEKRAGQSYDDLCLKSFCYESECQDMSEIADVRNRRKSSAEYHVHKTAQIQKKRSAKGQNNFFEVFQDERRMKMIVEEDNEIDWMEWNYWGLEHLFGKIESQASLDSVSVLTENSKIRSGFCAYCLETYCDGFDCVKIWSESEYEERTKKNQKQNNEDEQKSEIKEDFMNTEKRRKSTNHSFSLIRAINESNSYLIREDDMIKFDESQPENLPKAVIAALDSECFNSSSNVVDDIMKINQNFEDLNLNISEEFPSIKKFAKRIKKNFWHRKIKKIISKRKREAREKGQGKWANFFAGGKFKYSQNLVLNPLIFKSCRRRSENGEKIESRTKNENLDQETNKDLKSLIKPKPRFLLQKKRKSSLIDPDESETDKNSEKPIFIYKCLEYEKNGVCNCNVSCRKFHFKAKGLKYSELKRCLFNILEREFDEKKDFQLDRVMNRFFALQPPLSVFEKCMFRRPEKNVFDLLQIE